MESSKNKSGEPESLFFSVRTVRLLTEPQQESDGNGNGKWRANATFYPGSEKEITVNFVTESAPDSHKDDYVWVVYRGKWEALTAGAVIGHVFGTTKTKITGPGPGTGSETGLKIDGEDWYIDNEEVMVTCPLLASTGSLAAGSKVIVSLNIMKRKWEIIDFVRKHYGHQYKTLSSAFTQNNAGTAYVNLTLDDGNSHPVYCPLLRSGESLGPGVVIISYNQDKSRYEIIEAQCPAASAAALPGGEEPEEEEPAGGNE